MATLMTGYAETGLSNPKFVRRRASDGAWWSTAGTPAFESYNASNIASYGITAAETGSTGVYTATDPAETTTGDYVLVAAAGASLAVSDVATNVRWQGDSGISTLTSAQVNAEVLDVLNTDTFGEPTGVPGATVSLAEKIGRLYSIARNKITVTSSTMTFFSDAGASLWTKALTDDGTTYTEAEGA